MLLEGGANHDTLSLDVISGQVDNGVEILGTGTKNNTVETSEIGTDPTGTASVDQNGASLANIGNGVEIFDGALDNTLTGDVISNNGNYGVYISDPTTSGNVVEGSVIGTNAAGWPPCPMTWACSSPAGQTTAQSAGPPSPPATSSRATAPMASTSSTTRPATWSRAITSVFPRAPPTGGHAASLPFALGNGASGVAIYAGASHNTIGGTAAGSGNVISGQQPQWRVSLRRRDDRQLRRGGLHRHRPERLGAPCPTSTG